MMKILLTKITFFAFTLSAVAALNAESPKVPATEQGGHAIDTGISTSIQAPRSQPSESLGASGAPKPNRSIPTGEGKIEGRIYYGENGRVLKIEDPQGQFRHKDTRLTAEDTALLKEFLGHEKKPTENKKK